MPPRFVLILWPLVGRLLKAIYHIRPLKPDDSGLIHFDVRRYKGPTKVLDDGCEVKAGDTIIELHLNNAWFKRRRNLNLGGSQASLEFLASFAEDLGFLAQQVASGMFGNVVALHGVTLLHVAAERLGFQVGELPDSLWKRGARFYMAGLMRMYHWRGDKALRLRKKGWEVKEVWLSTGELLAKYGPKRS